MYADTSYASSESSDEVAATRLNEMVLMPFFKI